jgi:hypothetical protein
MLSRTIRSAFAFVGPLVAVCLVMSTAGCGYKIGPQFNTDIHTVAVPIFKNDSDRRGLEFELTEAVQKQITTRTPFRLVHEADADTILRGRVVSVRKQTMGRTGFDDARELQLNVVCEVSWEDVRTGRILAEQNLQIAPDLIPLSAQAEFAPEVGQSLATARAEAFDRLARNIVDMMEVPAL